MEAEVEYTAVGCNRAAHCAAWSASGLVCYGANAAVAVYSPAKERIIHTLVEHKARVNCVRWVEADSCSFLVSGSSDHSLAVWQISHDHRFTFLTKLEGHTGSVTVAAGIWLSAKETLLVASSSADSSLKLWQVTPTTDLSSATASYFSLSLGSGLLFDLELVIWPAGEASLFYAADDCRVSWALVGFERGSEWQPLERLTGHEDWVTSLNTVIVGDDLIVASGGQDSIIRLWRIQPYSDTKCPDQLAVRELVAELPQGHKYSIHLESVLSGHEDKVYSVQWRKTDGGRLALLSASLDKTMLVWAEEEGVWVERARVGETGGNTLGMLGGCWGPNGQILGYSFGGAFHLWLPEEEQKGELGCWQSGVMTAGHQGAVADLAWQPDGGSFLLSVGVDQTTRCHAYCSGRGAWHEVGRPQVHGYDLTCVATLPELSFVSGAEEKVLRAFQAPQSFRENFVRLTGHSLGVSSSTANIPQGASLPTLGLSNKAVYAGEKVLSEEERHVKDQYPDFYFTPEVMSQPPAEESLVQNTLWPEVHKLYGHGYELYTVASDPTGRLVASACKSAKPEEAAIIIWSTASWQQIGRIEAHSLTVSQLSFAPLKEEEESGLLLLSVSRDRSWAMHQLTLQQEGTGLAVTRLAISDKRSNPHKRIIWTCCWSYDAKYFATGSRDKLVCLWGASPSWQLAGSPFILPEAVTALAMPQVRFGEEGSYLMGVGLENGEIQLVSWHPTSQLFQQLRVLDRQAAHHASVAKISFRPGCWDVMGSGGHDHLLKIYKLTNSNAISKQKTCDSSQR